jgi:hypothetical protein
MSWDPYVTDYLLNYTDYTTGAVTTNANDGAAIVGLDGTIYAIGGNIELRNSTVDQEQDDGSVKKLQLNEFNNLVAAYATKGTKMPEGGIRVSGQKYMGVGGNDEFASFYLKKTEGGACVAKTETCYVIAVWNGKKNFTDSKGKSASQNPGLCNKAVEALQKFLVESGC